jgi:hypothetical protein
MPGKCRFFRLASPEHVLTEGVDLVTLKTFATKGYVSFWGEGCSKFDWMAGFQPGLCGDFVQQQASDPCL